MAQGDIRTLQLIVGAIPVLMHIGTAQTQPVRQPVLATHTVSHLVAVEFIRHIFVVHHQEHLVTIQRLILDNRRRATRCHLCEWPVQNNATLNIIHLVITAILQGDIFKHAVGITFAHLHPDLLGTLHDIGVAQVVETAAGTGEFIMGKGRVRLRTKHRYLRFMITETRDINITVFQLPAVETAVILNIFVAGDTGIEISPQYL